MALPGATVTLQARVALLFLVQHFSSCSRGATGTEGPDSTVAGKWGPHKSAAETAIALISCGELWGRGVSAWTAGQWRIGTMERRHQQAGLKKKTYNSNIRDKNWGAYVWTWCGLSTDLKVNKLLVQWQGNSWETQPKVGRQGHDCPTEAVAGVQTYIIFRRLFARFPTCASEVTLWVYSNWALQYSLARSRSIQERESSQ